MENKTSKYLKYAIGEIILVVIGILIALQINNWNEQRKSENIELTFIKKLLADIEFNKLNINQSIKRLKEYEDLHYQLYLESKGKATYNKEFHYGWLRWNLAYYPRVGNLYQNQINSISSQEIKDAFNDYFIKEKAAVTMLDVFARLKQDRVRPFITNNNIINVDTIYNQPKYQEVDTRNSINYQKLKTFYGTDEFDQILYELKVKTSSLFDALYIIQKANTNLSEIIRQQIKE